MGFLNNNEKDMLLGVNMQNIFTCKVHLRMGANREDAAAWGRSYREMLIFFVTYCLSVMKCNKAYSCVEVKRIGM